MGPVPGSSGVVPRQQKFWRQGQCSRQPRKQCQVRRCAQLREDTEGAVGSALVWDDELGSGSIVRVTGTLAHPLGRVRQVNPAPGALAVAHKPPAIAGTIEISSESLTGVSRLSR